MKAMNSMKKMSIGLLALLAFECVWLFVVHVLLLVTLVFFTIQHHNGLGSLCPSYERCKNIRPVPCL
jgi:hypothetical protein